MRSVSRLRLLPPNGEFGWTPYAWLIYLPAFTLEPLLYHRPASHLALTLLATVAFLATYFRGYWLYDRRILAVIAAQVALGVATTAINTGSAVMFVYAAAFACRVPRAREALYTIAAIWFAGVATAWAFGMPLFFWAMVTVLPWVIGGVNLHFAQVGRANRRLKLAQHEIAHLATVAERERIARDLHDLLGHTLSLVALKAELAGKLVDREPARARREIGDVERVSREALQQVRATIRGYHASLADELARARTLLVAAGVEPAVDAEPVAAPRAVDETAALALREAVTNVVRHSGARACRVTVRADGATLRIEVADDGHARGADAEGSGLRGMRERVEALGGTVARRTDRGTTLTITLPSAEDVPLATTAERAIKAIESA
jgi:two-component system sensor histidine kinase DesK